jgi:hypothetical protein
MPFERFHSLSLVKEKQVFYQKPFATNLSTEGMPKQLLLYD